MDERLRRVELFAELADSDLERICGGVQNRTLAPGEVLFSEGDPADSAYVIAAGEVEIVKALGARETLLSLRGAGDVIGEIGLLLEAPRSATVRARTDVELLTIPCSVLDALLDTSPPALRSMYQVVLARLQDTSDRRRQTERMAQLGTLTAGVAHELNNPAAGAHRAADRLQEALDALAAGIVEAADLDREKIVRIVAQAMREPGPPLDGLARSDAEDGVADWLADQGVPEPWSIAPDLVDAGVGPGELAELVDGLDPASTPVAVELLTRLAAPRRLAREIATGTGRISDIVGSLKSHAYLDRAPMADVDLHRGIDDTLMLLGHKLAGIRVVRDFDPDLPHVTASGGELNQVWTNLVDNAAYELSRSGVTDPTITVSTSCDGDEVVVEVTDNGPGIPPDVADRIFEAFYTTKPPGSGTGQGLNLSYQIIVLDHRGSLTVESVKGRTTFRVILPIRPPAPPQAGTA